MEEYSLRSVGRLDHFYFKTKTMKKILFLLLFVSSICSAQILGVKLNTPKVITIVPAVIITADSIIVNQITDNGTSVIALVHFYVAGGGMGSERTKELILWEGAEYITNKDYTKTQLKARIKTILSQ